MLASAPLFAQAARIGQVKATIGGLADLWGKVVTSAFYSPGMTIPDYFYVQEPCGSGLTGSGIQVYPIVPMPVSVGDEVTVFGYLDLSPDRTEACVNAYQVEATGTLPLPDAIGISQKSAVGGIFCAQPALYSRVGPPATTGNGLNAVGSRVRIWGKVTWSGWEDGRFVYYVDDGSNLQINVLHPGIRVPCLAEPPDPQKWQTGAMVTVLGVLGAEMTPEGLPVPVVRLDTRPPLTPVVTDGGLRTTNASELLASWTGGDPESGIADYLYAIGTSPTDPGTGYVVPWTAVGISTSVTSQGLSLTVGSTYYFYVKSRNSVDLWSGVGVSDGITVDASGSGTSAVTIIGDNMSDYPVPGGSIPKYEKYEVTFAVGGIGSPYTDFNPFNPNLTGNSNYYDKKGVKVEALITTPGGSTPSITWPCFWYETFTEGYAQRTGSGWKLRFAPTIVGTWKYRIRVSYGSSVYNTTDSAFACSAPKSDNHGFVKVNTTDRRLFQFSDGVRLLPMGTDISGMSGDLLSVTTGAFADMKTYGANFTRVFLNSLNIERNCEGAKYKTLNSFQNSASGMMGLSRAVRIDKIIEAARVSGVYVSWVLDDWTYVKSSTDNPYITTTGRPAPCATSTEFFSSTTAKEIYKRKLRYWMARWGYSVNLMALEFINEIDVGGSAQENWHNEMADYIHSFTAQPHMATGSNGSNWLKSGHGINWNSSSMDFVNFHDYAKYSNQWTYFSSHSSYDLEQLGIYNAWPNPARRGSCDDGGYPWIDSAVWVDRIARVYHKLNQWGKPLIWSEYGLIYRDCISDEFPDWNTAYVADGQAQHFRNAIWAGMFSYLPVSHWKLDYIRGASPYTNGGKKFWVFGPLSNFMDGEDVTSLTQETTYPVADTINPSPQVKCFLQSTTTANNYVMVMALRNSSRAYLYVKNLTNAWAKLVDVLEPSYDIAPTASTKTATIKVSGLTPSHGFTLEKWSTTQTNPLTQKLSSTSVTSDATGSVTFDVTGLVEDFAYKIK